MKNTYKSFVFAFLISVVLLYACCNKLFSQQTKNSKGEVNLKKRPCFSPDIFSILKDTNEIWVGKEDFILTDTVSKTEIIFLDLIPLKGKKINNDFYSFYCYLQMPFFFEDSIKMKEVKIMKFDLKIFESFYTFNVDTAYKGFSLMSESQIKDVIIRYNIYSRYNYCSSKEGLYSNRQLHDIDVLISELVIAVLSGSKECLLLFNKIQTDFPSSYPRFELNQYYTVLAYYGFVIKFGFNKKSAPYLVKINY